MQHKEKQFLLSGITAAVEEAYGQPVPPASIPCLHRTLEHRIDEFLMESQPIVTAQVTVVIADIRGFTALTEAYPVDMMAGLLNRFFNQMVDVVRRHDGVVDKFMGDSVMALFGIPGHREDDLQRALACAVEMQYAMSALNHGCEERGEPSLYAGVAVSTGAVMAGSFGSCAYSEYTVIGDPVNLAARIEGYSLRGQILLSESTRDAARDFVQLGSVNQVFVKGKKEPVNIYELKSISKPRLLPVPEVDSRRSPRITVEFPVIFRKVVAKKVLSEPFVGTVNNLSYYGLSADFPVVLPPCSEILMSLSPSFGSGKPLEMYARVVRSKHEKGRYRTNLEFTTIDTPAHREVKQYVDHELWGQ